MITIGTAVSVERIPIGEDVAAVPDLQRRDRIPRFFEYRPADRIRTVCGRIGGNRRCAEFQKNENPK